MIKWLVAAFKAKELAASLEQYKSAYNEVVGERDRLLDRVVEIDAECLKIQLANESMKREMADYYAGLERSDETSVVLKISDDLSSVAPHTKVNPKIVNKLIEEGFLPASKSSDSFAINLAVMVVAADAVESIVSSFERTLIDVEGADDDE